MVEEGNPVPYCAWATSTSVINGCLNGIHGFTDDEPCVLDYDFTFGPGVSVTCFGLRMVDYGDSFPFGGSVHRVTLTGYDAGNHQIDQDVLTVTGGPTLCSATRA